MTRTHPLTFLQDDTNSPPNLSAGRHELTPFPLSASQRGGELTVNVLAEEVFHRSTLFLRLDL